MKMGHASSAPREYFTATGRPSRQHRYPTTNNLTQTGEYELAQKVGGELSALIVDADGSQWVGMLGTCLVLDVMFVSVKNGGRRQFRPPRVDDWLRVIDVQLAVLDLHEAPEEGKVCGRPGEAEHVSVCRHKPTR